MTKWNDLTIPLPPTPDGYRADAAELVRRIGPLFPFGSFYHQRAVKLAAAFDSFPYWSPDTGQRRLEQALALETARTTAHDLTESCWIACYRVAASTEIASRLVAAGREQLAARVKAIRGW